MQPKAPRSGAFFVEGVQKNEEVVICGYFKQLVTGL
jgi:hypothetical protein